MANPIKIIKSRMGRDSLRTTAMKLGVSAAYLCDIMNGNRAPGPKVLAALGLEKITRTTTVYRRINGN